MPHSAVSSILDSLPMWDGKKPFGLETPRRLLAVLGNPQDSVPAIHVTGTNGKGSVCAMLHAMLCAEGFHTGLFTSPHLSDVRQRCIIQGVPVGRDEFESTAVEVLATAKANDLQPSFFETVTAISFLIFSRRKLDWMVIEVGLGGRLDATNVLHSSHAAVITSIGLDHTDYLGNTVSQIALEKAGIFRQGGACYSGEIPKEALQVLTSSVRELGGTLRVFGRDFIVKDNSAFIGAERARYDLTKLSLPGAYQQRNAALAITVARDLGVSRSAIERGLEFVRWPGRLEHITVDGKKQVLFDAAHNVDGVTTLVEYLTLLSERKKGNSFRIWILFSVLERKNWKEMLHILRDLSVRLKANGHELSLMFTRSSAPSSLSADLLMHHYGEGRTAENARLGLTTLLSSLRPEELLVITGSIYLVGELREGLTGGAFMVMDSNLIRSCTVKSEQLSID